MLWRYETMVPLSPGGTIILDKPMYLLASATSWRLARVTTIALCSRAMGPSLPGDITVRVNWRFPASLRMSSAWRLRMLSLWRWTVVELWPHGEFKTMATLRLG